MFAGLATRLLAGVACAALIFGAGFGLEWRLRNGDDALAQVRRDAVAAAELKHQVAVAQSSGAAGQAIADEAAGAFAQAQSAIQTVTRTLIQSVPQFIAPNPVPQEANNAPVSPSEPVVIYGVPCGLVRLHDAAVTGESDPARLSVCPGESDGAPASVDLSRFAAVLAANYGACESNASQLLNLQAWARAVQLWYADLIRQSAQ